MKKLVAIALTFGVLSCHQNEQPTVQPVAVTNSNLGPVQEAEATLSDYSAVDGCGLLLSVEPNSAKSTEYAVSDSSAALIKQYVIYTNAVADLKAIIRFQLTGRKKDVLCGWSGRKPFDEALVLSIKPH